MDLQMRLMLLDRLKSLTNESHSLVNEQLHSCHFSSEIIGSIFFLTKEEEEPPASTGNGNGGVRFICFNSALVRNLKGSEPLDLAAVAAAAAAARWGNGCVARFK